MADENDESFIYDWRSRRLDNVRPPPGLHRADQLLYDSAELDGNVITPAEALVLDRKNTETRAAREVGARKGQDQQVHFA